MRLGRDGIAGLVLLGLSLVLLQASLNLPQLPLVPVGPGFYPRFVLGFLALASLVLIVQDALARRSPAPAAPATRKALPPRAYALVAGAFAAVGAYAFLLPLLGYRIATFLFVAGLQSMLGWPRSARRWGVLAAIAFATTLLTYLAFERYLLVLLPRGAWTGW
jgi:hypothetical protein